jgi:hypothetical protein
VTGKAKLKIVVDILMTASLLLLMSYSLIGTDYHEYIGIFMFVLFVTHHFLNKSWIRNVFKGKYRGVRIVQTVLVILILICMIGSMVSGIILSRHVFKSLPIHIGKAMARSIHMLSGYWGFLLMSIHLGFHWNMIRRIICSKISVDPSVKKSIENHFGFDCSVWHFCDGKAGTPGIPDFKDTFCIF